jgi:hypothetical protein
MKNYLLVLSCLLLSVQLFSQESYIDKIAKETCEYLESDEIMAIVNGDIKSQKLGAFMITLYNQYEDELLKEGFVIDFSDGSNSGRDFGEQVGMHMAKFCPTTLIALAGEIESDEVEIDTYEVTGKIVAVQGNEFSTVILKDEAGKTQKFLWLQNFKGSDTLIQSLEGLDKMPQVKIVYRNIECFSPQLQDYIIRKEIIEMISVN